MAKLKYPDGVDAADSIRGNTLVFVINDNGGYSLSDAVNLPLGVMKPTRMKGKFTYRCF